MVKKSRKPSSKSNYTCSPVYNRALPPPPLAALVSLLQHRFDALDVEIGSGVQTVNSWPAFQACSLILPLSLQLHPGKNRACFTYVDNYCHGLILGERALKEAPASLMHGKSKEKSPGHPKWPGFAFATCSFLRTVHKLGILDEPLLFLMPLSGFFCRLSWDAKHCEQMSERSMSFRF